MERHVSSEASHTHDHDFHNLSENNVALRVAWEMRRRGWSQERMAQELTNVGCPTHQSAISKIINAKVDGSRRTISVDEAIAMARVFGVPLAELPLPPESGEGRDLHDLTRAVTHEGRIAKDQYAQFLLVWARLRHRLSEEDSRTAFTGFLSARKVDTDEADQAVTVWLDTSSWHHASAGYDKLKQTLEVMGTGRDLTPPSDDVRQRHSVVSDLLRLRELFAGKIPRSPTQVVPDIIRHFADVLVRAGILEVAVPVINSYALGFSHPTNDVVAEIDRRLQDIADREPHDRLDYLESLAARIGLRRKDNDSHESVVELAHSTGRHRRRLPGRTEDW
ncbi:helix-turn-helix domain-containing protein [Nonomuraea insulae]|uniref:Helix-turn-helix domain-containing protein n=1 Tax=Nonomuraea insulae TaxID=1616787 RepID=A0ABW1D5U0_9ACTN